MFDRITIKATITDDECAHLASLHHLEAYTNESGTRVKYRSTEYKNLSGIFVTIDKNKLTISLSLHKYWKNKNFGRLRNDDLFTVSEAKSAFEMLIFENGLIAAKTKVTYFEIGMNMNVSYDPLTFMELVRYIPRKNDIVSNKQMFVDANYRINRQKTTEKHSDIRKYFKIYDKGWEMQEKKRIPINNYILRIETVYKRHNERSDSFFTEENIKRLVNRFFLDWKDLVFIRTVRADKGRRKSEIERAKILINTSPEEYIAKIKDDLRDGILTTKQYRTIREFVRDFDEDKFRTVISPQEQEYKRLFGSVFQKSRE